MYRYLLLVLMLVPNISFAAVTFSEIAWMGTKDSSSNEWIELQNNGDAEVSLAGYSIVSLDGKIKIILKGSVAANSFYLIERTDDGSVPQIKADLITSFGSGLSNSGETLRILNSDGSIVDEVVGGTDWKSIGGNSDTKDTAQYVNGSWGTGTPTPKDNNVLNSGSGTSTGGTSDTKETLSTQSNSVIVTSNGSGSSASSKSKEEGKKIRDNYKIVVTREGNIIKDIPKKFKATVFGFKDEELKNADIKWNFGDGAVSSGNSVEHTYKFEGTYPLTVWTTYNDLTSELKVKIDVLSQDVKIFDAKSGYEGYVKIKSNIDADISGYYLYDGEAKFVFPKGSSIYSKSPIVFSNGITGIVKHYSLGLYRNDGKLISAFGDNEKEQTVSNAEYSYSSFPSKKNSKKEIDNTNSTSSELVTATVSNGINLPTWAYWVISLFFIVAAMIIVFASKVFNKNRELEEEAKKYTLVEIDSNLE